MTPFILERFQEHLYLAEWKYRGRSYDGVLKRLFRTLKKILTDSGDCRYRGGQNQPVLGEMPNHRPMSLQPDGRSEYTAF